MSIAEERWCLACKHSSLEVPPSVKVRTLTSRTVEETEARRVVERSPGGIRQAPELLTHMQVLRQYYPLVAYCSKLQSLVVADPSTPSQFPDKRKECEHFEPR